MTTIECLVLAGAGMTIADIERELGQRNISISVVRLLRSRDGLEVALDELRPKVAIVHTEFAEEHGFEVIDELLTWSPQTRVLALTPPSLMHEHVAGAIRAGAQGFVPLGSKGELAEAIHALANGDLWLPAESSRAVLSSVADGLDLTAEDRQTKLQNIALGFIPLAGGLTAIMALLWRRYLGQIGVRPVDLAIDPTTRIVDAFFALSTQLGIFGPLLFVGTWIHLILKVAPDNRTLRLLEKHRRIARILISIAIVLLVSTVAWFAEVVVALFLGPIVGGILLARALDADDDFPAFIRIDKLSSKHALSGGAVTLLLFMTILSAEVMVVGPDLQNDGAHGFMAPRFLGFNAQPMFAEAVDGSRPPHGVLYLGGNADLYVLVDPCDGDEIEYVSVGSTRLTVIDTVVCE